jgi:hypothetical protein
MEFHREHQYTVYETHHQATKSENIGWWHPIHIFPALNLSLPTKILDRSNLIFVTLEPLPLAWKHLFALLRRVFNGEPHPLRPKCSKSPEKLPPAVAKLRSSNRSPLPMSSPYSCETSFSSNLNNRRRAPTEQNPTAQMVHQLDQITNLSVSFRHA